MTGSSNRRVYDHPGHPLHGYPVQRRMDPWAFPLLEVICEHGVGHPMPESAEMLEQTGPRGAKGTWSIHGCDSCCLDFDHIADHKLSEAEESDG